MGVGPQHFESIVSNALTPVLAKHSKSSVRRRFHGPNGCTLARLLSRMWTRSGPEVGFEEV
jgi:hypothetical protein